MPSCESNVLHTHDVIDDVTMSKSRSNIKIAIAWSIFIVQRGNKYCHKLWLTWHLFNTQISGSASIWKIIRGRNSKPFSGIFKIHVFCMVGSISRQIWKLHGEFCKMKPFWLWWQLQLRHSVTLNSVLYIHVSERVALRAISKANILANNANIVIYFHITINYRISYEIRFLKIADQKS